MKELIKALNAAKQDMGTLKNNARNGHFNSDYATLDEVIRVAEPALTKHGIEIVETPQADVIDGVLYQFQQLDIYHVDSGECKSSRIALIARDPSNPQQLKSARTYSRRQLWESACSLSPSDDDGNAASQGTSKAQPAQDPLAILKPHETAIIAFAASKGTIITGVHELPSSWLKDPHKLIDKANEYSVANTITKEVAK